MNLSELLGFIPLGLFIVIAGIMAWRIGGGNADDSNHMDINAKKPRKFKVKLPVVQPVQKSAEQLVVDRLFAGEAVDSPTLEYRSGTFTASVKSTGERGQVAH